MKPTTYLIATAMVVSVGVLLALLARDQRPVVNTPISNTAASPVRENANLAPAMNTNVAETTTTNTTPNVNRSTVNESSEDAPTVVAPLVGFFDRITKKPFGIYITPKTSPVQPEKFSGYHTGADAEATADESTTDVPVMAIAQGTVVFAGHVNGYGGVIIIRHQVDGTVITALYGHLRLSSFTVKVGSGVTAGKPIAMLGTGYTSETDGERKHLHFGLIKGNTINYKGYVTASSGLSAWEDPVTWLRARGA